MPLERIGKAVKTTAFLSLINLFPALVYKETHSRERFVEGSYLLVLRGLCGDCHSRQKCQNPPLFFQN